MDHILVGKQCVVAYDIDLVAFCGMYDVVNGYIAVK
jgi:hypothetical protein